MERIDELALGVRELDVNLPMGGIALRSAPGEGWSIDWSGEEDDGPVVERAGDLLRIRSGRGDASLSVRLTMPPGVETIRLNTGVEAIAVEGCEARISASTGCDDITLTDVGGEVDFQTGCGEIRVRRPRSLLLRGVTHQGSVTIDGGSLRGLDLKASGDDVRCSAALEPGRYAVTVTQGDIRLALPPDAPAEVDAQAQPGRIDSAFPLHPLPSGTAVEDGGVRRLTFGGMHLAGRLGEGTPAYQVLLRARDGAISLDAAPAAGAAGADEAPVTQPRSAGNANDIGARQEQPGAPADTTLTVLEALARGDLSPEEADDLLARLGR